MKPLTAQHVRAAKPADPHWDGIADIWRGREIMDAEKETQLLDRWRRDRDYAARDALVAAYAPLVAGAVSARRRMDVLTPAEKKSTAEFTLVYELDKMQAEGYGCGGSLRTLHGNLYTTMTLRILDDTRREMKCGHGSKIHPRFNVRVAWEDKNKTHYTNAETTPDEKTPSAVAAARETLNDLAARARLSGREIMYVQAALETPTLRVDEAVRETRLRMSKAMLSRTRASAFGRMKQAGL